ncbi:MAG TPA: cation:proton antiporter [Chloroflexota bacterium]|nr:cation:proton antiporter [Chloroflexota bacterium]
MDLAQTGTLLVLVFGALVAPLLSRRLAIPTSVVEILLGALFVNTLGTLANTGFPGALGSVGFAILMFGAGAEIDFDQIEACGPRNVLLGVGISIVSFGTAILLIRRLQAPLILGIITGVISIGIAAAVLREAGLLGKPIGQAVLVSGGLGEFLSLLTLTGVNIVSHHRFPIVVEVARLFGVLFIAYILLLSVRAIVWWYPERFSRLVATNDPSELGVRATLAVMRALFAAASLLGLEPTLGAFLAGGMFGYVFRSTAILQGKIASIGYGFLIPIFFIGVGASLRLGEILRPAVFVVAGEVVLITFVGKFVALPLLRLAGLSWRGATVGALFLSAPLTLQVAGARIAENLHLIGTDIGTAVILASVISGLIAPTLGRRFAPRGPGLAAEPKEEVGIPEEKVRTVVLLPLEAFREEHERHAGG